MATTRAPHPEATAGEVWIGNMFAVDFKHVGWGSKRLGKVAYETSGRQIPNFRPVFVARAEMVAAGVDTAGPGPLDHRWVMLPA